jgi:hypothetical protein
MCSSFKLVCHRYDFLEIKYYNTRLFLKNHEEIDKQSFFILDDRVCRGEYDLAGLIMAKL